MTVSYNAEVATSGLFTFTKLLFKWRGSTYKILFQDFLLFSLLYLAVAFLYHYLLDENGILADLEGRRLFMLICVSTNKFTKWIPLTFVLAFYVSIVIKRWWDMVTLMPWPDSLAVKVTSSVLGFDEGGRTLRRTLMRYANLSLVLLLREISVKAKKNFPTMQHVVNANLLLPYELTILEEIQSPDRTYWIPLVWCTALIRRAKMDGRIPSDYSAQILLDEVDKFREGLLRLKIYDEISIPLVYTQVVTIAVYVYFFTCLLARQKLDFGLKKTYDLSTTEFFYFPVFTVLEFFFFMGWLKVAESLVNPFGENDEDLEILLIVERNINFGFLVVDLLHNEYPELKEIFSPADIPYTVASMKYRRQIPYMGSTANIQTTGEDAYIVKEVEISKFTNDGFKDVEKGSLGASRLKKTSSKLTRDDLSVKSICGKSVVSVGGKSFATATNIPVIIRAAPSPPPPPKIPHRRPFFRRLIDFSGFIDGCRRCRLRCQSRRQKRFTVIVKPENSDHVVAPRRESSLLTLHSVDHRADDGEVSGNRHRRRVAADLNNNVDITSIGRSSSSCSTNSVRSRSRSPSQSSFHSVTQSVNNSIPVEISGEPDTATTTRLKTNAISSLMGKTASSTPIATDSRQKRPLTAKERNNRPRILNRMTAAARHQQHQQQQQHILQQGTEGSTRVSGVGRKIPASEQCSGRREMDGKICDSLVSSDCYSTRRNRPYQRHGGSGSGGIGGRKDSAMTANRFAAVTTSQGGDKYAEESSRCVNQSESVFTASPKESFRHRHHGFLPQESYTSFASDIRIRRPNHVRVYDSRTSLTSHQSNNIDDAPRVRCPGRYRTSSSLSTWSNIRTKHSVVRGGGAAEEASAISGSFGVTTQTLHQQQHQSTLGESGVPLSGQQSLVSAATAAALISSTAVAVAPTSMTDLGDKEEKREEEPQLDPSQIAADVSPPIEVEDCAATTSHDLLSQIPPQDEKNLALPLVNVTEHSNCNSPSEKQVKFNLDPETILVDPSLPAASTMENTIILSPSTEAASFQASNAELHDDKLWANIISYPNTAARNDAGDESGTNIDDQEETDTGSTISSVVAADNYKSEFVESPYVFEKKSGVAILETIAECSSDVSLNSQSSSVSSKTPTSGALLKKGFRPTNLSGSLGRVDERFEDTPIGVTVDETVPITSGIDPPSPIDFACGFDSASPDYFRCNSSDSLKVEVASGVDLGVLPTTVNCAASQHLKDERGEFSVVEEDDEEDSSDHAITAPFDIPDSERKKSFSGFDDSVVNISLEALAGSPVALMSPSQISALDDAVDRMEQLAREIAAEVRPETDGNIRDNVSGAGNSLAAIPPMAESSTNGAISQNQCTDNSLVEEGHPNGNGSSQVDRASEHLKETLSSLGDYDF